jgi:hypothetical protein
LLDYADHADVDQSQSVSGFSFVTEVTEDQSAEAPLDIAISSALLPPAIPEETVTLPKAAAKIVSEPNSLSMNCLQPILICIGKEKKEGYKSWNRTR